MSSAVTVRLDRALQSRLDTLSKRHGVSRSDIIRDALKRQLALLTFEKHREIAVPLK